MQKHIKNLLENNALLLAIIATIIVIFLSLGKPIDIKPPIKISFLDKILHASAYFTLSLSWFFAFRLENYKLKISLALFFFGIIMEFLQGLLTNNRQQDPFDAIANSIGIIFAYILFEKIFKYYQKYFDKY